MSDLPIACTLSDTERRQRRSQVLERVFARTLETRPLDHGYAFRFAAEEGTLNDLMELIQLERRCCAFLQFGLTVEPGGGPVWLELAGPEGTKAFLETELGVGPGIPRPRR